MISWEECALFCKTVVLLVPRKAFALIYICTSSMAFLPGVRSSVLFIETFWCVQKCSVHVDHPILLTLVFFLSCCFTLYEQLNFGQVLKNGCICQILTTFYIPRHKPFVSPFPFLWSFYPAFFVRSSVGPEESALFRTCHCSTCLLILHRERFSSFLQFINIVAKVVCLFINHTTCGQTAIHMLPRHDREGFPMLTLPPPSESKPFSK